MKCSLASWLYSRQDIGVRNHMTSHDPGHTYSDISDKLWARLWGNSHVMYISPTHMVALTTPLE